MNRGTEKLKIWVLLLAMFALASCIKEKIKPPFVAKEVVFLIGSETGTRAATGHPIDNVPGAGNQDKGVIPDGYSFGVYAWEKPDNTSSPIINFAALQNMEVTRVVTGGGDTYPYSPVADWPVNPDAQLSFMAYYPWTDQTTLDPNPKVTSGAGSVQSLTLNYTVSTNSGEHVDLMYAKKSLTSGYAPVNIVFGHALTRLMFEAHIDGFPGGSIVKITGISITGATLKGELEVLDPAVQPGKPDWSLDNGVTGIIEMPSTHIKDVVLDGTLQSVMKTEGPTGINGDMLVLPQELAGLKLVVEATFNGVTFYNTFDLDGMDAWEMNEITVYEITLKPQGKDLTARVLPWGEVECNVIPDPQFPLNISPERLLFGYEGGSMDINLYSSYDKDDRGFDAGIYIDPPVGGFPSWLKIANAYGAEGGLSRIVSFTADPNETEPARSAKFTIRVGNLNYTYNIVQYPKVAPRITWDVNTKRYAITYDPRDVGLYFKFGSVVGVFSGSGAFTQKLPGSSTGTVFNADVHLPWNPTGVTGTSITGWDNVPSYTSSMFWNPVSTVHTVANVKNGIGDPCRLVGLDLDYIQQTSSLSLSDIDNYTWRLPTNAENQTFSGSLVPVISDDHWWNANDASNIAYNIAGGEFPTRGSGGPSKFLPAAGLLGTDGTDAKIFQEETGGYWSENPYTTGFVYAYGLLFSSLYYLNPSELLPYNSVGYPVRCVYDPQPKPTIINVTPATVNLSYEAHSPAAQTLFVEPLVGGIYDPTVTWTLTSSQTWLWLTLNSDGTGGSTTVSGTGSKTIYIVTSNNNGNAPRYDNIYLNGNSTNVVTVVTQGYFQAIGQPGTGIERIYIEDNNYDPKLMLTQDNSNPGAFFQFGGIRGWKQPVGSMTGVSAAYNPSNINSVWNNAWQPYNYTASYVVEHTVASLRQGTGDPCRLVGYTQSEIITALSNNIVPDNHMWRLPTGPQLEGYTSSSYTTAFPRFGYIYSVTNNYLSNGTMGYYWSSWRSVGGATYTNAGYLRWSSSSSKTIQSEPPAAGMSIRCVAQ